MGSVLFLLNRFCSPEVTCLCTARNKGVRGNVFIHFRSNHVRSCRICSCKQHTFIKLHQVTNDQESVLSVSRMSFCTKGIPARSCRIQCLAKRRKTFSLGRRCPSVRMRGGETHGFQVLTHRPRRSPLSWRTRVHYSIMDSATPPQVFAQNDSIA